MATYRLKEWFLTTTGTANKAGTRFKDGDKPNESAFADWFKSSLFKSEPDDRAKEDVAGTTLADINGHVVAATDAQAKANQAKKEDRTVVAQASQLPSVGSTDTLTITSDQGLDYNDQPLNVYKDDSVSTRSNYLIKFKDSFSTFLSTLVAKVEALESTSTFAPYTIVDTTTNTYTPLTNGTATKAYYTVYTPTAPVSNLLIKLPPPSETTLGEWGFYLLKPAAGAFSPLMNIEFNDGTSTVVTNIADGKQVLIKCIKQNFGDTAVPEGGPPEFIRYQYILTFTDPN